jgi:hypothetical protein
VDHFPIIAFLFQGRNTRLHCGNHPTIWRDKRRATAGRPYTIFFDFIEMQHKCCQIHSCKRLHPRFWLQHRKSVPQFFSKDILFNHQKLHTVKNMRITSRNNIDIEQAISKTSPSFDGLCSLKLGSKFLQLQIRIPSNLWVHNPTDFSPR